MPSLEYFVVCQSVSVDISTNDISLFHVLEDLFLDQFPYVLPKITAASCWNIGPDERTVDYQATLRITRPGESEGKDFPTNLAPGRTKYRAIQGVLQIPLEIPGQLKFEILLNGHREASHIVTIHPPGSLNEAKDPEHGQR